MPGDAVDHHKRIRTRTAPVHFQMLDIPKDFLGQPRGHIHFLPS